MFLSVAHAQAVGEVAAAHNEGGFPPFDVSFFGSHLFWLVVCFGIFYWLMARIIIPRIGDVVETRQARIADDLGHAARMKQEADAAILAYETALVEARQSAAHLVRDAAQTSRHKAEQARQEAEIALERHLADAEGRINAIRESALRHVDVIAEEVADEIVYRLIGEKVGKTTLAQAVAQVR